MPVKIDSDFSKAVLREGKAIYRALAPGVKHEESQAKPNNELALNDAQLAGAGEQGGDRSLGNLLGFLRQEHWHAVFDPIA